MMVKWARKFVQGSKANSWRCQIKRNEFSHVSTRLRLRANGRSDCPLSDLQFTQLEVSKSSASKLQGRLRVFTPVFSALGFVVSAHFWRRVLSLPRALLVVRRCAPVPRGIPSCRR